MAKEYDTLKLPRSLMKEVDDIIEEEILGFRSRAEFAADAIRDKIEGIRKTWSRDLRKRK